MLNTSNDQRKLLPNFEHLFATTAQAPGGVACLRELILTLAVQGKLVAQDASDEPASELLKKIQTEKERLMAEGKIKKDKPLAEITDEEKPFELPVGWEWVPLGEVIDVIRGITFPASEKTREPAEGRIACLRTANVQKEIEWDDILYVSKEFMSREEQLLQDEDIVMSMANSRELVGKVALIRGIPVGEATFGGFLSVLRPYFLAPVYVMNVLRTSYARSTLIDSASQTTNIANISLAKLRPFAFPLPPLAEQSRIVTRVEELMRLCDALEEKGRLEHTQHQQLLQALLDSLTQITDAAELARHWQRLAQHFDLLIDRPEAVDVLEQTILQLAVRGLLVPQDPNDEPASDLLKKLRAERKNWLIEKQATDTECRSMLRKVEALNEANFPYFLPDGWIPAKLIDLSRMLVDCHNKTAPYVNSGIPIIRTTNIRNGDFRYADLRFVDEATYEYWSRRCPPEPGDLIFTREAPMGEVAIIPDKAKFCLGQRTMLIRPMHEFVLNKYLHLALMEPGLLRRAAPSAIGSTVQHLRVGDVENLDIALPPLAEQTRIVARVTELRTLCQQLRDKLTQARTTQTQLAQAWVEQVAA